MLTGTGSLWPVALLVWPLAGGLIVYYSLRRWVPTGPLILLAFLLSPFVGYGLGLLFVGMISWAQSVLNG